MTRLELHVQPEPHQHLPPKKEKIRVSFHNYLSTTCTM